MTSRTRVLLALAGALLLTGPARAGGGDYRAQRIYQSATKHWNDPDPGKALELLDKALSVPDVSVGLQTLFLVSKGTLMVAKLGDPLGAEPVFDKVLVKVPTLARKHRRSGLADAVKMGKDNPDLKDRVAILQDELNDIEMQLQSKAQAMVAKANICYSERGEVRRALKIYLGANYTWESAATCDVASQFCYRVSRESKRDADLRAELLRRALGFSWEALRLTPTTVAEDQRPAALARYLLQLEIVLHGCGEPPVTALVQAAIDPAQLGPATLYQQAVLAAAEGQDAEAGKLLRSFFDQTRPTAQSRNDLRKFVRTEPDFAHLVKNPDWAYLVTDEPVEPPAAQDGADDGGADDGGADDAGADDGGAGDGGAGDGGAGDGGADDAGADDAGADDAGGGGE